MPFLIAHTHSLPWKERDYFTTKATPIINGPLIAKLLETLQLPAGVALIHCQDTSPLRTQWP